MTYVLRDGDWYAGEYEYDTEKDKVSGCPARVSNVQLLVKTIRAKAVAEGKCRKQVQPMSIEDLGHIVQWSEVQCPLESLNCPAGDSHAQALVTRHAFMCTFMTMGFTLWTRYDSSSQMLWNMPHQLPIYHGTGILNYAPFVSPMSPQFSSNLLTTSHTLTS